MKQVINSPTIVLDGMPLQINTHNGKYWCYVEILVKIKDQLDAMLSHHSRVMTTCFHLHTYEYSGTSDMVSKFFRKLKKKLKRKYKAVTRVGHIWAREWHKDKKRAKSQHYHCAIFLNQNAVQHPSKVLELIEDIWTQWEQPKPYTPKNCYHHIGRGDQKAYGSVFKRLSYYTKVRGKGHKNAAANDYSTSRIKHKAK
jgi:hypothetical protein